MKWFVYSNETYYPYAKVIEAADVEGALADFGVTARHEGVAVFPLEALAHWQSGLDQSIEEALEDA
jgi:hypothetical protein